ncbi:hypothetical protein EJB05_53953, partial [Eragrostis curvula]
MKMHHPRLTFLIAACVAVAAVLLASRGAVAAAAFSAGNAAVRVHGLRRVEEDASGFVHGEEAAAAAAYPQRRALYSGGSISYGALTASKAACYGPCPARGQPYTNRGCQAIFQCRGGV